MSKRSAIYLLEDILDAIDNIQNYTHGMSADEFMADGKTKDAVVRNFEVIGEAANNLPKEILESQPQIQWSDVIGFRHVLIHHYFGVDYGIVWNIIQHDLQQLSTDVESIVKSLQ